TLDTIAASEMPGAGSDSIVGASASMISVLCIGGFGKLVQVRIGALSPRRTDALPAPNGTTRCALSMNWWCHNCVERTPTIAWFSLKLVASPERQRRRRPATATGENTPTRFNASEVR